GGGFIMYFAFDKLGSVEQAASVLDVNTGAVSFTPLAEGSGSIERFWELNKVRMNMFLPSNDSVLPWTALMLGLWIPNFYYWGLNQYITQRTLGSRSLAQGQKGIVFAAALKLIIPFVIVIPGIIAFNLFAKDMQLEGRADNAVTMARYLKANPDTQLVDVVQSPTEQTISFWSPGRFMIALYDSPEDMKAIEAKNAFVLPMQQSKFDEISISKYTVFKSDDKSWTSTFPALAAEVQVYNEKIEMAAAADESQDVATEKFIAYKYDTAMAQLLGNVLPQGKGYVGFVLAALLGAVVSSLAAMLNAASTIFTMDIFKKYIQPDASQTVLVLMGRVCVVVFSAVAILLAPKLGDPKISNSIFTIIQEGQGFISPGILAVFVFGLIVRKAPPMAGVIGLLTNIVAYGAIKFAMPAVQFLNRMALCFGLCLVVMAIITIIKPLAQPIVFKHNTTIELETSNGAKVAGIVVVILTLVLYFLFSPIGLLR
ncbi:MAG: hypothetical protein JW912_01470, partial [Sedimentisphaerales bacterium]|nr:hypothetical protein [Sedimentisphaerales bacterium]